MRRFWEHGIQNHERQASERKGDRKEDTSHEVAVLLLGLFLADGTEDDSDAVCWSSAVSMQLDATTTLKPHFERADASIVER